MYSSTQFRTKNSLNLGFKKQIVDTVTLKHSKQLMQVKRAFFLGIVVLFSFLIQRKFLKFINVLPYCLFSLFCYFLPFPRNATRGPAIQVFLVCYYRKDLYSPSIHQSQLPHPIILRPRKQKGVWTIQRFILFFIFLFTKCYTYSYYTILLTCWLAC